MKLGVVILAAGKGTRMKSALPKVMHTLGGNTLLGHVLHVASTLTPHKTVVVYGHGGEHVRDSFSNLDVAWVEQAEQLGTGHAVQQALPYLGDVEQVLVLYGDVPLIRTETLQDLIDVTGEGLGLLTVTLPDPQGYGRIVRDDAGKVTSIVEQKDASADELRITEINTGIMAIPATRLEQWMAGLQNNNAQQEYYLTDVVAMAVADTVSVNTSQPLQSVEAEGINDRLQLARLEREWQSRQTEILMLNGVTLRDPARFDLRGELSTGQDVCIDINVIIEGAVTLGDNVSIGANTVLRNVTIGTGVTILENCVIEDAEIGMGCKIGPFSRIRPGARLAENVHVGNFVEIKNSNVLTGSKINHLSYVGDSDVGAAVNIGAGTITCNYDGANKHRTIIGDRAFIGSNSALVAPVTIGDDATIAAGSVISKPAPADKLTITRPRQVTMDGWKRPTKKKDQ